MDSSLVLLLFLIQSSFVGTTFSSSYTSLGVFKRSSPQEPDTGTDVPPPNSTEAICMSLAVSVVASAISTECSMSLAQYQSAGIGSEEEKTAVETLCVAECGGELARFFQEECGNSILAESFIGLCSQMDGIRCYYIREHYNWTAIESHCSVPGSGEQDCSDTCAQVAASATETVGCCSHYQNFLDLEYDWKLLMSSCGIDMPEQCPNPFQKVKEEEEEEETDKPTEEVRQSEPASAVSSLDSGATVIVTHCLVLVHVFLYF